MRLIRSILLVPILVFASPALLLLSGVVLMLDTKQGPLRSILLSEIQTYGAAQGFQRFMEHLFVPTYKHSVQSFVLGAAGFLVVTVGLRGLGVLPLEFVYAALAIEFTLLMMWALTVYFTVEEPGADHRQTYVHQAVHEDKTEKLVATIKDLSTHLALLENRLKMTEARFEHLGKLDESLQGLSSKLNTIVSDQFNLRVKREFDQLLSELSQRASENNGTKTQ